MLDYEKEKGRRRGLHPVRRKEAVARRQAKSGRYSDGYAHGTARR